MTKYKLSGITFCILSLCVTGLLAQDRQEKLNERISVASDVALNLNTSHTNVVFETWNRNEIGIEAYVEGENLDDENSKRIIESWQLDVLGDDQNITINSRAGNLWSGKVTASNFTISEEDLRKLNPAISDLLGPLIKNIENNPMPNSLSNEQQSNVNLSNKRYSEQDEKYVQQWESQIREKFSDEIEKEKQKLAKQLEKNGAVSGDLQIKLEWGEQYGRQMEAWAAQFVRDIQNQQQGTSNVTVYQYTATRPNTKGTSKVIKVKMPKNAKLKLNIRHGAVQLAEKSYNVKASLSHTRLSANVIDGDKTFIKASYSPVFVRQWNDGRLESEFTKRFLAV